jgi:hypothetical protein
MLQKKLTLKNLIILLVLTLFISLFFLRRIEQQFNTNSSMYFHSQTINSSSQAIPTQENEENSETIQTIPTEQLQDKQPLSNSDTIAKENIIASLPDGETSGILYQSPDIIIDYTKSVDDIQVEILTTDISKAEAEAVTWFTNHGLSKEGICNMPIQFYLNFDIKQKLKTETSFSPLPDGC